MLVTNGQDCDSEDNLIVVKRSCLIPLCYISKRWNIH